MTPLPGILADCDTPRELAHRELLLAAAECPLRTGSERLAQLAAAVHDWPSLIATARRHRLAPLLASRLASSNVPLIPAVQQALAGDYQRNVVCSLANASELIALLEEFSRERLPVLPFKGIVLAASVWGGLGKRPAGDLDLLIRFEDLGAATRLMLARGYQLSTRVTSQGLPADDDCHEYHFERAADGMVVELRWRLDLFHNRFRRDLGLAWLWPHRCTATLAGAAVPDVPPEFKLLVICMHASRHTWSRLIWVCDVAQLIASSPALDWDRTVHEASRTGLTRCLRLGVLLAHSLAGASLPPLILRRFQQDATAAELARHFTAHIFDHPGMGPPGGVPFCVRLLDPQDRIRYFFSSHLLRPTESDRAFLPLPKSLDALYYLIRPVRLLLDRSPR